MTKSLSIMRSREGVRKMTTNKKMTSRAAISQLKRESDSFVIRPQFFCNI